MSKYICFQCKQEKPKEELTISTDNEKRCIDCVLLNNEQVENNFSFLGDGYYL
jgi:hypothetical protein